MRRRRYLASVAPGLALSPLAGCTGPTETATESRSIPGLDGASALRVENRNGEVSITGEDRQDGDLSVTNRTSRGVDLDRIAVEVTAGQRRVRVAPVVPEDVDPGAVSVEFDLRVPESTSVERVATRNGPVAVESVGGDPALVSRKGELEARAVAGVVRAETTNGEIRVRGSHGIREVLSTNGRIDPDVLSVPDDASVTTANGDVTLRFDDAVDCDLEVRVGNGDVETVDIDLGSGTMTPTGRTGTLGAGGPLLAIEATNGDVLLTSR